MANDDLIEADIRRVLEAGDVTWVEFKRDELWHVEGRDTEGRMIRLVVAVSEKESAVKVVTAMTLKT